MRTSREGQGTFLPPQPLLVGGYEVGCRVTVGILKCAAWVPGILLSSGSYLSV